MLFNLQVNASSFKRIFCSVRVFLQAKAQPFKRIWLKLRILFFLLWAVCRACFFSKPFELPSLLIRFREIVDEIDWEKPEAKRYLDMLLERIKEVKFQSRRADQRFIFCVAVYWLLTYGQMSEISLFSLKVSGKETALWILPTISAYFLYQHILKSLHYLTLQRLVDSYFFRKLPKLAQYNYHVLPQIEVNEFTLATMGRLKFLPSLLFTVINIFGHVLLLLMLLIVEVYQNIFDRSFAEWRISKIMLLVICFVFLTRAIVIAFQYVRFEVKDLLLVKKIDAPAAVKK